MVSTASIISMVIALLICFGLPIGLAIYFYKKERIALVAVAVGALVFLVIGEGWGEGVKAQSLLSRGYF